MGVDELPEGTLVADGPIAVYDREKAVRIMLERDEVTTEDAIEYLSFNVEGAYVGEGTPLFVTFADD